MNRASYRAAIEWIALNDEAGIETADEEDQSDCERRASEYVTSALIADIFGVESARVGRDVMRKRRAIAATGEA
jgi:hypothetical protein